MYRGGYWDAEGSRSCSGLEAGMETLDTDVGTWDEGWQGRERERGEIKLSRVTCWEIGSSRWIGCYWGDGVHLREVPPTSVVGWLELAMAPPSALGQEELELGQWEEQAERWTVSCRGLDWYVMRSARRCTRQPVISSWGVAPGSR